MSATTQSVENLVRQSFVRDKMDELWRRAVKLSHRALKVAPGGHRKWIFYQAEHGPYVPHRAIQEMIDLLTTAGAPDEDVSLIAQYFVDYTEQRLAERHASRQQGVPSVREALRLETHADAEADCAQADAAVNPTPGNLEKVLQTTARLVTAEEVLTSVCRRELRMTS